MKVSSWAVQSGPGVAECTICFPRRRITFGKGLNDLTRHSESEFHIKCSKNRKKNDQPTLEQFAQSKENDQLQQQASDLEIAVCSFL